VLLVVVVQLAARNKWLLRLRPTVDDHQQFASAVPCRRSAL